MVTGPVTRIWKSNSALVLIFCLTSCHSHPKPVIAGIPETTGEEIWEGAHAGAAHAARDLDYAIYWNAPMEENELSRQIQLVDSQVARGIDGLILAPDHAVALISPVRSALARGVPTVIICSPLGIEPGGKLAFILNDDQAVGNLVADRLAPRLNSGDAVAILGDNPAILSHAARSLAIQAALRARVPGVEIVERQATSYAFDEAEQITEEAIRGVPHLRAIVALNLIQTRASYFAMRELPPATPVLLLGCDQDLDLVRHMRGGEIDSLVAQDTFTMAYEAVQTIDILRHGGTVAPRRTVAPVLVTRENVDRPEVQQILRMDWRVQ